MKESSVPIEKVRMLMRKYKVNPIFTESYLQDAIKVEQEHRDVVGNNIEKFFRIVLDHLREYPSYYLELHKMEKKLARYWDKRTKPRVSLP